MNLKPPGRGEHHPLAALSNREAKALKGRYQPGVTTLKSLAEEARISASTARRIVRGLTYREEEEP